MLIPRLLFHTLRLIKRLASKAARWVMRRYRDYEKRLRASIPLESYEMTDDQFEQLLYGCTDDPPSDKTSPGSRS